LSKSIFRYGRNKCIHGLKYTKISNQDFNLLLLGFLQYLFNPISAGVLENQDMLGGGQVDPPPLSPMFDVQI